MTLDPSNKRTLFVVDCQSQANMSILPGFVSRSNSFSLTHNLFRTKCFLSSLNTFSSKLQHFVELGKLTDGLLSLLFAAKMKNIIFLLVFLCSLAAASISGNCGVSSGLLLRFLSQIPDRCSLHENFTVRTATNFFP